MKTFLKWHVPVAECWQPELWGVESVPCATPKYPKYAPTLAAKPQQCLLAFPSSLGPRVCVEISPLSGLSGASAAKGGAAPAWRLAALWAGKATNSTSFQLWPLCPELLSRGHCVCVMGKAI